MFAQKFEVSHNRLTPDCIYVKEIDFKNDTISIEVDGFEKVHLESLGINFDA